MSEADNGHKTFAFGECQLETESQTLRRGGGDIHLAKRPFQILLFLIENRERIVSRDELLEKFWNGRDVYDDALRKAIGTIRHAIDDNDKPPRFIETRYGSGYRFVGTVFGEEGEKDKFGIGNLESEINEGQGTKDEIRNPQSQIRNRTVLAVVFVSLIALGFFAYRQQSKFETQMPDNLTEAVAARRSIAVLPLKNLTGDAANDYLTDGITESLINELSRVPNLKVISRSSVFGFKDKNASPQEIGEKLNVETILEGGVRRTGDRVRVETRLVNVKDGSVLWASDSNEEALSDILAIQDGIVCQLVSELKVKLCEEMPKQRYTRNADAYQAYLKGRYQWNKRTGEGIERSIEHYRQAIAFDSDYAPAYAGLADSYVQGIWRVPFAPDFALPKAIESAKKAIELDDASAEAHTALASAYQLDWNWEGTERELKRAIELDPKYARAHHVYAFHLSSVGRWDEALASINRAQELDPLNTVINADTAMIMWDGRGIDKNRIDAALAQCLKVIEMDANYVEIHEYLAIIYWLKEMPEKFVEEYVKVKELGGEKREIIEAYKKAFQLKGVNGIFQKELKDRLAARAKGVYQSPPRIAQFYALVGDKESAFEWLEGAFQEHNPEIVGLKAYPFYDPLRSDPRFTNLLKRAGLPE